MGKRGAGSFVRVLRTDGQASSGSRGRYRVTGLGYRDSEGSGGRLFGGARPARRMAYRKHHVDRGRGGNSDSSAAFWNICPSSAAGFTRVPSVYNAHNHAYNRNKGISPGPSAALPIFFSISLKAARLSRFESTAARIWSVISLDASPTVFALSPLDAASFRISSAATENPL